MQKRVFLIDVLRGFCVLLVIFRHLHIRIPFQDLWLFHKLPDWVWKFFFLNGNEGVIIFFVVSGFLITSNTLTRYGSLQNIKFLEFYKMRFARIAPPLLLLLSILFILHVLNIEHFVIPNSKASLSESLFAALTFQINWLEGKVGYLPGNWDVLWSLSVEEVFYFLFPLVCLLTRWKIGFISFTALIILSPLYRNFTSSNLIWTTKAYLSNMGAISMGCLAATFAHRRIASSFLGRRLAWASLIGIFLSLAFLKKLIPENLRTYRPDIDCLAFLACVFLMFATEIKITRFLRTVLLPFERIGHVSYEMYLFHMFFVYWAADLFAFSGKNIGTAIPLLLAVVAITYLCSFILEKHFSSPMRFKLRNGHLFSLNAPQ